MPARDDEVLEELPRRLASTARALRAERARLADDPRNLGLALAFAWRAIEAGRAEADPRFFGWAEGALAPWLAAPEPAPAARLVRATLRQNRHDFAGALAGPRRGARATTRATRRPGSRAPWCCG